MAFDIKRVEYYNTTVDGYAGDAAKLLSLFAGVGVNLLAFKAVSFGDVSPFVRASYKLVSGSIAIVLDHVGGGDDPDQLASSSMLT